MKCKLFILLAGFLFLACSNNNTEPNSNEKEEILPKTFESASDYNNAIVKLQASIFYCFDELEQAINNFEPEEMNAALNKAKSTVNNALLELKSFGGFKENFLYFEAAKNFFETYLNLLENEYSQLVDLYKLSDESFGEKENIIVDSLDNSIAAKQDSSFKKFWKIQMDFGKEFEIIDN